ncbi:glutamate receptor-like [Tachypleus tridentatus]|uniref:glutamate receptor-like n=1 Tax=Tachypleus tridentatus TaxID=6853 RepID=UPI003FD53E3A
MELWLLYIAAGIGTGAVTALLWIVSCKLREKYCDSHSSSAWKLTEWSFSAVLKGLVWQGAEKTPSCTAPRLILGSWGFVTLLVLSVFSGNIRAFLNVEEADEPIDTIEEAMQKNVRIFFNPTASISNFLQYSSNSLYQEVWHRNYPHNMEINVWIKEEVLKHVQSGGIYLNERSWLKRLQQPQDCSVNCPFHVSSEHMRPEYLCLGLQKPSYLESLISEGIRRLTEAGIIDYLDKKDFMLKLCHQHICEPVPAVSQKDEIAPMTLNDVGVAFIILIAGHVISLISFCVEYLTTFSSVKINIKSY